MNKKLVLGLLMVCFLLSMVVIVGAIDKKAVSKTSKVTVQKKSLKKGFMVGESQSTMRNEIVYSTDFETENEWTAYQQGAGAMFEWLEDDYHSPTHSWHVADDSVMDEANAVRTSTLIVSPLITLPTEIEGGPVTHLWLTYWFKSQTPNTAEGGYVYDVWRAVIGKVNPLGTYWHVSSVDAYGGAGNSWWCANPNTGTYEDNWETSLRTPELDLSGASGALTLNFANAPSSETDFDYCYVEISDDGGGTWTELKVWDVENDPVAWSDTSFDISAFNTANVVVRWRFTSDGGYQSPHGWHIDNVEITDGTTQFLFDDGGDTAPTVLIADEGLYYWAELHYEYDQDDFGHVWTEMDDELAFNGSLDLYDYAGEEVVIGIRFGTDGWNRTGQPSGFGVYFDDVQIEGVGLPPINLAFLGIGNVGAGAAGVGVPLNAKAYLANAGQDTINGTVTWYGSITDEVGTSVATIVGRDDVVDLAPGDVVGIETVEQMRWVPEEPGNYHIDAYLVFPADEFTDDDVTETDFVVPGPPWLEVVWGEDFEGGGPSLLDDYGFTVENGGGDTLGNNDNTWVWPDAWIYGAAPGISGYFTYENPDEELDETLITPEIDISGVSKHNTLYMSIYIYFRPGHSGLPAPWGVQFSDLTIEYTVDGGNSWNTVWYWADDDGLPGDALRWPQTILGIPYYTFTELDISEAVGNETLQLRFNVTSENSYVFGISVDEILIYKGVGRPMITSVEDVPEDNGKQVRVCWDASFNDLTLYDAGGEERVVTHYGLWRACPEGSASGKNVKTVKNKKEMFTSFKDSKPGDRYVTETGCCWDFIACILAHQDSCYCYVAPTLWDSVETFFMVSAHTDDPMVFVDSEPMAGMSIDNLAPAAPGNVAASSQNNVITVTWDASVDEDVQFYTVYRRDGGDWVEVGKVAETMYEDTEVLPAGQMYYYAVSATDFGGNESEKSMEAAVETSVAEFTNTVPEEFALYQNYPNPFNPVTHIRYSIPEASHVTITVYNANGQEVATLVNVDKSAGNYVVAWDAADFGSGIYFYSIKAGNFSKTIKMILMK